jgi:hypothetical protein
VPTYRLVVYDSADHDLERSEHLLRVVLGLGEETAGRAASQLRFEFLVRFEMADRGAAERAADAIVASGRDSRASSSSRGSLPVAVEEVADDGTIRLLSCGRGVDGTFVPMDRAAIEALQGGPLDESRPYGEARLQVIGRRSLGWGPAVLLALAVVLPLTSIWALSSGLFPWLYSGRGAPHPLAILLVISVPLAGVLGWIVLRTRTLGRVTFFDKAIVLEKRDIDSASPRAESTFVVPWSDLRSFRDDHSDFVQLNAARPSGLAMALTIPTLTERDRTAVLDLLVQRGVPRDEGGATA